MMLRPESLGLNRSASLFTRRLLLVSRPVEGQAGAVPSALVRNQKVSGGQDLDALRLRVARGERQHPGRYKTTVCVQFNQGVLACRDDQQVSASPVDGDAGG